MKKGFKLLFLFTIALLSLFIVNNANAAVTQYGSIPNSNGKAYYEFDSATGELRLRALNGATETAYISANATSTSSWPWNNIKDQVKKVTFAKGTSGYGVGLSGVAGYMFADMPLLEEVDFSGMGQIKATGIARMFSGCKKLKKIDMSMVTTDGNLSNMQNMFNGCSELTEVIINNPNFITRDATSNKSGAQLSGIFKNCSKLETLDLSNITITAQDTYGYIAQFLTEQGLDSLKTVLMENTKFKGVKTFDSMFKDLTSLEKVDMSDDLYVKDATSMINMFSGCTSLKDLNVSGFGKLDNIINMNDFVKGCKALETLNLDNLDNSVIGPTSKKHTVTNCSWGIDYSGTDCESISREDSFVTGAVEFGREIFGIDITNVASSFPNLTTVSAQNSKVWLVKNSKGLQGSEYYNASSDGDILYLSKKQIKLDADNGKSVTIETKRDYIDIMTDRDGNHNHIIKPSIDELPDNDTNINIKNGDLNTNGPGFLAPGVYNLTKNNWIEDKIDIPTSYYRISFLGEVPYKVEGINNDTDADLYTYTTDDQTWVNTKVKSDWPTSGNYVIDKSDNPIKITYQNAAIDVNGKKHDLVITITKITFKNLERIPTYLGRHHDPNRSEKYVENNTYHRTILQATKSEGLLFRNYVRAGDPGKEGSADNYNYLSGGSGTDIDFTVAIDGANPNTSFIFHVDDLDVAESQDWQRPTINTENDDADLDFLPYNKVTYGEGGEAFVLGSGNDLNTVEFAKNKDGEYHTGLFLSDNKVLTTGSDPQTPWSEFAVKAAATGSKYTWTSGIACTTYALNNTPKLSLGEIEIQPIKKVFDGGTLEKDQFEFTLTPDNSVENNKASSETLTAKNDENGNVVFDAFIFDSPDVQIDGTSFYPGTVNDETNTHGGGTHNKFIYAWTVSEKPGQDENIEYDTTVKKLKVIISTPENDKEMEKGIKAEIYVDDKLVNTVWSADVKDNKFTSDVIFKNIVMKEVSLKVNWDDFDDAYKTRPGDITGFIKYKHGDKTITVDTTDGNWSVENNVWTFKFKIPASAKITDWGQTDKLTLYTTLKKEHNADSDVYEITNKLKIYDLTITKEVTGSDANKNDEFDYTIVIKDSAKKPVVKDFVVVKNGQEETVSFTEKGYSFKLKHNDKIVIKGLLYGYSYEVEEKNTDYVESYKVINTADKSVVKKETKGRKVSSLVDDNQTIIYNNNKDKKKSIVQTGIDLTSKPFVLMSFIASLGILIPLLVRLIKLKIKKA